MAGGKRVKLKQAIAVIGVLAAMLWGCTAVTAEQAEGQIAPLLPMTFQVLDVGNGRFMARLAMYPGYIYFDDAGNEIAALVEADQLRKVQGHAYWIPAFYVPTQHLVLAGKCSRWKRVYVTLRTWGPCSMITLAGSDPTANDKRFVEVATGSGPQRILPDAIAGVTPMEPWGGHGNCRVTFKTGASITIHCSAEELLKALQKARAKPQARLPLPRSGPLRKAG